jgi:hypothetical protein
MTFWCGSGSADPCLRLMDPESDLNPDPDADLHPATLVNDLQEANKKLILFIKFFCLLLFEGTFTSFSKIKSVKEVKKQEESKFFFLFCLIIEGSGAGSGFTPLTSRSESGSRRPKNMWI